MIKALKLWQLISPNLPIGAYAYSGGLEWAVESGQVASMDAANRWLSDQLLQGLARLDLPFIRLLVTAWSEGDHARVDALNDELLAYRDTKELRAEDIHLGNALARVLGTLDMSEAFAWQSPRRATFATLWALAVVKTDTDLSSALHAYAWSWVENQVAAAVKLIPLGQTQGQQLLWALHEVIVLAVEQSLDVCHEHVGSLAFGVSIASSQHETQHTRLYRS